MLEVIGGGLTLLILILGFILKRRPKAAEDILSDTPLIDSVQEEARRKADEKFGKE